MYKTWTGSSTELDTLARDLEAHLNEYADEVVGLGYAVTDAHHVLVVYKLVEADMHHRGEVAVSEAEHIIEGVQI